MFDIPSAMLNTPRAIQDSSGFTLAAVFPNKELNMHINPAVRPPSTLPPPVLTVSNQSIGPTQPLSAGTPAQAIPAIMVPPLTAPLTGQNTAGLLSGFGRSLLGSDSTVPGSARGVPPASKADTGSSFDVRLPSDFNKIDEVELGLDMDMDVDVGAETTLPLDSNIDHGVDLSLDMDMDVDMDVELGADNVLDSKVTPKTSTSPSKSALPVKSADSADPAPSMLANPTNAERSPQLTVTASIQPAPSPEAPVHSPLWQQDTLPIDHHLLEIDTRVTAPKAAPEEMPTIIEKSNMEPSTMRSPSPPRPAEEITSVLERAPSHSTRVEETVTSAQPTSPPAKETEKAPTVRVKESSRPATSEEPIEEVDIQAPKITENVPAPLVRDASPPITSEESMDEIDVQAHITVPSLPPLADEIQDKGAPVAVSAEKAIGAQSECLMSTEEELASILNHPMQEDTVVLNAPSRARTPEPAQTTPRGPVEIDMDQPNAIGQPASLPVPKVTSPPRDAHLPPPIATMPGPPSSPGPAPPSQSPPPLPDSLLRKEIPASTSAIKSPVFRSRAISPINSLPTTPPVPPGGGKMKLEVVIDQAEFENSKDGYFRRLTATNPDDIHPNPLLATFGFTKSFGNHLLNKRCVITTNFAKDELKQLVLDAGGTIIPFDYGVEFEVMLVSNDLYPTLAQAQGEGDVSSVHADIWSFGAADFLDAKDWKLRRRIPKRSGLVSFTSGSIIKAPELFLECLRKIHNLRHWNAFLSAETIQALHHFIKNPSTPQTNKIRMFRTMNDATGLFKVRYPRTTDIDDPTLREQRQMVVRKIEKFNRWVDVQQEISKNEHLMKKVGTLCAQFEDKIPAHHRKYWEREAEILYELLEHQYKTDEIYAMKRSIFVGFNHSAIRKDLGKDALSEMSFQDIEPYEMEDLLKRLSSDGKFAGLLRPSEERNGQDSSE
ncbi:hypothetical protein QFC22_004230 [Naganishia vaughanmartiniae]|uniref:Uncharacterized protein n=1 Tax=Naganishia vaughanmartiniae TaxID=1424756 RepID=A0ACC2X4Q4_9TREE|nr:hypothetical protein QFC22_004230 [Naganishia vaughanmartiniae]